MSQLQANFLLLWYRSTKHRLQISQNETYKTYKQFNKNKNNNFFYCCFHELKHVPSSLGNRNH